MPAFDVNALREEFPALGVEVAGRPVAYFDGPGGTQVSKWVIDAVEAYYRTSNANAGGAFATSERSDALAEAAHHAVADLYGASDAAEIKLGYNMTTLTFHVSRSIAATMVPGDEIVVTTLDHDANVAPWRAVAADRGLTIRTVDIHPEDSTLDLEDLDRQLSPRTRLLAVGYASNAVGTINPVREIARRAHAAGAWIYIDAVHMAPHREIDVADLDADFLVTSAYKWFGPHLGALYGRRAILEALPAYKVRPAHDRFETGTPNLEAVAGTWAAVDYLASVGRRFGEPRAQGSARDDPTAGGGDRRRAIVAGMRAIRAHELGLLERLAGGLRSIPGVRQWGIADPSRFEAEKAPTLAITLERASPRASARALGDRGIFAWDGDFYAQGLIERLGLAASGGVLRLGIVHYNTEAEVDRLLEAVETIAAGASPA